MSRLFPAVMSLALLLTLGLAPAAGATTVKQTRTFHMDNTGTGCGADAVFVLSPTARTGGPNCGYVGGLPFSEVFTQTGDASFGTKSYATTGAGLPIVLDAATDLTGQVRVIHASGTTGVGQVRIDVTLRGLTGNKTVTLGTATVTRTLMGELGGVTINYTMDLADAQQGVSFTKLTLDVNVRGAHANTGYTSTQGDSRFVLPILVEEPTA